MYSDPFGKDEDEDEDDEVSTADLQIERVGLTEILRLLDECTAIILSGEPGAPLMYPAIQDPDDADDDVLLRCSWHDDEGQGFDLYFTRKDNQAGGLINYRTGVMVLVDQHGGDCDLTLLRAGCKRT